MSKVNKILMATVAILLTLVLISTSVVSSVFARFTIKKQASTVVGLEKFGVSIKLTPNNSLKSTEQKLSQAGDTISVKFTSDLLMGQKVYDALKVEVTGTPNVNVKLRISCKVDFEQTNFTVDNNDIYGAAAGNKYMPLGFTAMFDQNNDGSVKSSEKEYVCRPYHIPAEDNQIDEIITRNIAGKVFDITYYKSKDPKTPYDSSTETYYFDQEFSEEIKGNINCFYLGFDWLAQYDGNPTNDANTNNLVATHLAEKAAGSRIIITYTFHVEQTN